MDGIQATTASYPQLKTVSYLLDTTEKAATRRHRHGGPDTICVGIAIRGWCGASSGTLGAK